MISMSCPLWPDDRDDKGTMTRGRFETTEKVLKPEVPPFYTKDYDGTDTSINS